MNVIFAVSEMSPFASTGGLAEVAEALPEALAQIGIRVCRIMPFFRHVAETGIPVEDTGLRITVPIGLNRYTAEIWKAEQPAPPTYFVRRDEFFDRTHLYGLPYRDYEDNLERFVFFQKCIVELIDKLALSPDIVHCNDWQTGLLPLLLAYGSQGIGRIKKEACVFTIHNLSYQGIFAGEFFSDTNLPLSCYSMDKIEYYGQVNCMKAGIITADMVTTVSKSYAEEIQTEAMGFGLEGVIKDRRDQLRGIVNGISPTLWNPADDKSLSLPYNAENPAGKRQCKKDLIERTNLDIKPATPLIGMVQRLVDQKGLGLVDSILDDLMALGVGLVVLGTGHEKFENMCRDWQKKWPGRVSVTIAYDARLAHRIEGGADMSIIASRYEPCGLNQLYGLRYGTLPIAHATGGLKDTIRDLDQEPGSGNGFLFSEFSAEALLSAVKRAIDIYNGQPDLWAKALKRAMNEDHSWTRAAKEYAEVYRECCPDVNSA